MFNVKLMLLTAVLVSAVSFGAPTSTKKSAKAKAKSSVTAPAATTTTVETTTTVTTPAATEATAAPAVTTETSASTAPAVAPSTAATVTVPTKSQEGIVGELEIAPGYDIAGENSLSENLVRLGYKFNKDITVSYQQDFSGQKEVVKDLRLDTGRVISDFKNIVDFGNGLNFGYQNRIYLPVGQYLRDDGMVTTIRNYLSLNQDLGGGFAISLMEVPFIHVYNQDAKISGALNPAFQNRVILAPSASFLNDRLSASLLIVWDSVKRRGQIGAWDDALWIQPEVGYKANDNVTLGLRYYNNNFIKQGAEDGLALDMGEGFKNGVVEFVLNTTI